MTDGSSVHGALVDRWLESAVRDRPPDSQLRAFEGAFDSLWQRAHETLGEVTLTAIVDRVLYTAAERHPILAPLKLTANGPSWQALGARSMDGAGERLPDAIRFVLVEFLTVLGNLTAEILTPSLHAALAKAVAEKGREENAPQRERQPTRRPDGEEAKS